MAKKKSKNAQDIKAMLVDFIIKNYKEGIIASEVPVEEKQSIVDMMFIGDNELIGFEIKSDYDTITRLGRQIQNYYGAFNQLYIVCGKEFYKKIGCQKMGVGLIIADDDGLKLKRKATHRKFPVKSKMVNFLWKADLPFSSLKKHMGINELKLKTVNEVTSKELFQMVIKALKNRYQPRFDSFMKARGSVTFVQDIDVLTIQDRYL